MPDTEALRRLESAETAIIFVVEGVGVWTDVYELAAQDDYFGDGRPVWTGLKRPPYQIGIDVLDARDEDFRARIQLQDQRDFAGGGYLASLFRAWDESEEPLGLTIRAGDTPLTDASVWGRHVGTERIGPAGERCLWPSFPGWGIGGEHLGQDYENADLPAAVVSDVPIVYRGRRCSLWRVYRDRITYPDDRMQGWRPWAESVRLWWGELEDGGSVDGSLWSIECRGPDAYKGGQLATLSQDTPVPIRARLELSDTERRVAIRLYSRRASSPDSNRRQYGESIDFSLTLQPTYTFLEDLIDDVATIVHDTANAVGTDGRLVDQDGQSVEFSEEGVRIRIDDQAGVGGSARYPVMHLCMSFRVWRACGWDPILQNRVVNPADLPPETLPGAHHHEPGGRGFPLSPPDTDAFPVPGPDYYTLSFSTVGGDALDQSISPSQYDFEGKPRLFPALYPGGVSDLPADLSQPVTLSILPTGGGIVRHTGQYDRPPTIAGRVQGLWLLEGPRSMKSGEVEDEVQVVVATWSEGDFPGSVGAGTDAELLVTRWLDPRRFGIDRDSIPDSGYDWAILQNDADNPVTARPVFRLGYSEHGYDDRAVEEILRLMFTTGASTGWTGAEGDPTATLDTTPNEPPGSGIQDAEVRDLGLAIPRQLIAPVAQWRSEFAKLPDGLYQDLAMLITPGAQASEIIEGWMRFYGVLPSLHGGRYGVVTLLDRFDPADVAVTLTMGSKERRENDAGRTTQALRVFRPVDTFDVSYRWDPAEAKYTRDESIRANDRGARYRSDGRVDKLEPKGIRKIDGWRQRRTAIARFWERRHFKIQGWPVLSRLVGEQVWPGTIVRLTEPRGVSQAGTYGIDGQIGMVTHKREDLDRKRVELDIIVQADASRPFWVMAPSALGFGFDYDSNEVMVRDDWQGLGNGWSDVLAFIEPEWSTTGGALDIKGLQWDGQTMMETWTGTVAGVTATPGAARIHLTSPPVGRYFRDMPCWVVPREYDAQSAAYARQYFAVIGDENGEHGAGLRSSRWSD